MRAKTLSRMPYKSLPFPALVSNPLKLLTQVLPRPLFPYPIKWIGSYPAFFQSKSKDLRFFQSAWCSEINSIFVVIDICGSNLTCSLVSRHFTVFRLTRSNRHRQMTKGRQPLVTISPVRVCVSSRSRSLERL